MKDEMLPNLQCVLVCEDVRLEVSGSNTIVGVVNVINAPVIPFRALKLCVFTRWCSGRGAFRQATKILTPREDRAIAHSDTDFQLPSTENHATNVAVFGGIEFPEAGDYSVEIYLNGELEIHFPMRVALVQPPKQQPSG